MQTLADLWLKKDTVGLIFKAFHVYLKCSVTEWLAHSPGLIFSGSSDESMDESAIAMRLWAEVLSDLFS